MNGIVLTLLSFYGWLLLVRFLTMRGLGPFSSFTRDMSKFMLGKALGPANELFQNRPGSAGRTWLLHGVMWFIIASTLTFTTLWRAHEPDALASLGSVGYAPTDAQSLAALHLVSVFGALSMTLIGAGLLVQSRLSGSLASESNGALMGWAWSATTFVGLILAHTSLIGEVAWFELPPVYYLVFSLIALPLLINHLLTVTEDEVPPVVPQWFLVLGLASLVWIGPAGLLLLQGENQLLAWWMLKVVFGCWLLATALGIAHHVVPAALGRPLWSRSLSTVALAGTFLTVTPLGASGGVSEAGEFLQAMVGIFLALSLLPLIAAVANLCATASGGWQKLSTSHGASMTMVGVVLLIPVALTSLFASVSAFGGGDELSHIAGTLDMLAIWAALGLIALGGAHCMFPHASGRQLFSQSKSRWTFWMLIIGVFGFAVGQLIVDHVDATLAGEGVAEALEAAEVTAPDLAGSLALFAAVMFYGVVVGSLLLMQNMIMGIFRGVPVEEDLAVPAGPTPVRHTLTAGSTSIRRLLSVGVGVDTEIIVGDDDGGRLSLADLASQADGVDDDAGSEADEIADADEEADEGADEVLDVVSLNRMRKTELVDLASSLGKESSGTKADIISRLVA